MNNFLKLTPRVFIFTNLFWLFLFGFLLFNYKCSNQKEGNTENCDIFCYNYSNEPFDGLNAKVATTMADNYANLYDSLINGVEQPYKDGSGRRMMENGETKSVWFSLSSMKNLIYQMERSTCQLKCDSVNANNLGIRFYFAKYPDASTVTAALQKTVPDTTFKFLTKPQFTGFFGRKTLFMVPTYNHPTLGDVDFDPKWTIQKGKSMCNPQTLSSILMSYKDKDGNFIDGGSTNTFRVMGGSPDSDPDPNNRMNHNPLCPPVHCPGQSF